MANKSSKDILEDYLDVDPEIPNQKYALVSFISPEKVLADKNVFFFENFLKSFELDLKIKSTEKFLAEIVLNINRELDSRILELENNGQSEQAEICRKNRLIVDDVIKSHEEFVRRHQKEYTYSRILESYKDFLFKEQNRLEDEFHAKHDFRTTIRGLKIRGVCANEKEAEIRAKKLRNVDTVHDVFMAEVGKWTPWDPSPHQVQNQDYAEEQLNDLMKRYKENEQNKEKVEEERRKNGQTAGGKTGDKAVSIEPINPDEHKDMFGVVGDLALQRKMNNTNESATEH
jgi:hypothetical protein